VSAVAVDTSVLLAIFKGEPKGEGWLECLQSAAERATLLVSSVVFAEVRSFFPSDDACRKTLRSVDLRHSRGDAGGLAGDGGPGLYPKILSGHPAAHPRSRSNLRIAQKLHLSCDRPFAAGQGAKLRRNCRA
jgi:PIN domain